MGRRPRTSVQGWLLAAALFGGGCALFGGYDFDGYQLGAAPTSDASTDAGVPSRDSSE
jgi:hypothetical protein